MACVLNVKTTMIPDIKWTVVGEMCFISPTQNANIYHSHYLKHTMAVSLKKISIRTIRSCRRRSSVRLASYSRSHLPVDVMSVTVRCVSSWTCDHGNSSSRQQMESMNVSKRLLNQGAELGLYSGNVCWRFDYILLITVTYSPDTTVHASNSKRRPFDDMTYVLNK